MRTRPLLALTVSAALLAAGCTSSSDSHPSSSSADVVSPTQSGSIAAVGVAANDVQPWLAGPVQGGDASGPTYPTVWPAVVIKGSGTATSRKPTLVAPGLSGQVQVQVVSLTDGGGFGADAQGDATKIVFEGNSRADRIELPADSLSNGQTYAWRARAAGGAWVGPWTFDVDTVRSQSAPTDDMGGVQVNLLSGVPAVGWQSPTTASALGGLSIALAYRPEQPAVPGLPAGWVWALPGTGALELIESEQTSGADDPLSVTLKFGTGAGTTFVRTESGAYVPGLADGTATRYSQGGLLTHVSPGIWQYMGTDGSVTRYEKGRPVAEWAGGKPIATFSWDDSGRLTSAGDGVARTMTLHYAGSGACPAEAWGHDFAVVDGMWCATENPDGTTTAVGYVGDHIGIIADAGGVSASFGWDAAGRLAAVRSSDGTAAAATSGESWAGTDLTTQIAYDNQGRVESVTSGAATPGGQRVTRTYTYPALDATDQLSASAAQVSGDVDNGTVVRVTATADTWQVLSRTDNSGRSTKAVYDSSTGALIGGTDNSGRKITMKVDADTVVQSSVGPYTGSSDTAMRTDRIMDATPTDPARGADSPVKPWHGLAANVWNQDTITPMWWDRSVLTSGLGARLNFAGPWTAQATGTWTAEKSGPWVFAINASDNLSVDVTIDGSRCTNADGKDGCVINLKSGSHSIAVAIEGDGDGSFAVRAGVGAPADIDIATLVPSYGATTVMEVNDEVNGRNVGTQLLDITRPWTSSPDSVTTSGGLTTTFAYEPTDPTASQWGRLTSKTTPGGSTQTTSYYGDDEQASDPCTGTSYPQAGLLKTTTRYDGVKTTSVYNASGLPVSQTVTGADNAGEQTCMSYDSAGRMTAAALTTQDGTEVNSASSTYIWKDGQLTTTTTVKQGGNTFTTVSVSNVLGELLSYVDSWGVRTTYTYNVQGLMTNRTTYPKGSDTAALTVDYAYDEKGNLVEVKANGESMATITYSADELPSTITYPGNVTRTLVYDSAGAQKSVRLSTPKQVYDLSVNRNKAGRILDTQLAVAAGQSLVDSQWDYTYDAAGRLVNALLSTSGDTTVSGGAKRKFTYDYTSNKACPSQAGSNFDRTGGSRDGVAFVTCYDQLGRLASTTDPQLAPAGGKATTTWDGLGRLTALDATTPLSLTWSGGTNVNTVTEGSNTTEFVTVGGQILQQTIDGTTTKFAYNAAGGAAPSLVMDESGNVTSIRLGLPGGAQANLTPQGKLERIDHVDLFAGWLTSTTADGVAQGDGAGALAAQFGPYGEPLVTSTKPAEAMSYGWQAAARNPSLGGSHNLTISARPYHPWLGQFLAFDPSAGSSPSGYGYADADPLNKPDYSGNFGVWEWMGVIGGVVAAIGGLGAGKVAGTTNLRAWGLTVGAMAIGTTAAALGIVGTWLDGESMQSSIISTSVAAIGIALSVRGAWNWNTNYFNNRTRLYAYMAEQDLNVQFSKEIKGIESLKKQMGAVRAGGPPTQDRLDYLEDLHDLVTETTAIVEKMKSMARLDAVYKVAAQNGDQWYIQASQDALAGYRRWFN